MTKLVINPDWETSELEEGFLWHPYAHRMCGFKSQEEMNEMIEKTGPRRGNVIEDGELVEIPKFIEVEA